MINNKKERFIEYIENAIRAGNIEKRVNKLTKEIEAQERLLDDIDARIGYAEGNGDEAVAELFSKIYNEKHHDLLFKQLELNSAKRNLLKLETEMYEFQLLAEFDD